MIGLSGTARFGRSGTACSDDRELESAANPQKWRSCGLLNYANKESFGFLLTARRLGKVDRGGLPVFAQGRVADDAALTHVTLIWRGDEHEDWLRFGRPVAERIIDRRRRVESYAPEQTFALVRWASNAFGTVRSTLDIVRTVGPDRACTTLPQVDPGGDVLLSVRGWPKVRRVLQLIDAIEAAGHDPCTVAPDHWRHMHNRLAAGMAPRGYGPDRHRAWLARRSLQS